MAAQGQFMGMAAKDPRLMAVRPNGREDEAQLQVDVDRTRAGALGLSLADINRTLAVAWGSAYIDDFVHEGRVKRVYLQADAPFRMLPEDLDAWYVRNKQGEMVPFSAFAKLRWVYGSPRLERFNGLASAEILGQAAPGVSSGEAMAAVEELVRKLPSGIGLEWTGISYEERSAGAQAPLLFSLSVLVVLLTLAALYESWSVPFRRHSGGAHRRLWARSSRPWGGVCRVISTSRSGCWPPSVWRPRTPSSSSSLPAPCRNRVGMPRARRWRRPGCVSGPSS
jgi:multidrug efflux pump